MSIPAEVHANGAANPLMYPIEFVALDPQPPHSTESDLDGIAVYRIEFE